MSDSLNWIDRTIGYFNPSTGLRRARARTAMNLVRQYEGAAMGRRTKNWRTPSTSSNAEIESGLITLRNRSRDLVRNNPYAAKAVQVIISNTVGYGVMAGLQDQNERRLRAANMEWTSWAHSAGCDAYGIHDFYGLQALALRTVIESGECLILRETSRDGRTPLRLRIIEPDHLDHSREGFVSGKGSNRIRNGIEYDNDDRPVAYYLYQSHPGDRFSYQVADYSSVRVPAERVIHLFRVDRPGQRRGVPWSAPVILRMRDLDDYEDAQLTRQKIAACFTVFAVEPDGEGGSTEAELLDRIEPGAIEVLPPGRDIRLASPPGVSGYNEYVSQVLRAIACGFGISYESLTGDLTNTNFSSGRMGWIEMSRNIEAWRWQMLMPQMMRRVWEWFVDANAVVDRDFSKVEVEWTPPRREMIDPTKEVPAIIDAIRGGLMTLSEAQRSFGFDPKKMLDEYKSDLDVLDKLGIILDSDARQTDRAGKRTQEEDSELDDAIRSLTRGLSGSPA